MSKPILLVDFDGVIHSYRSGWQKGGATVIPDEMVPGFWEWAQEVSRTFDIQVFSARSSAPGGIEAMAAWLQDNRPPGGVGREVSISFPTVKPAAFLTIDDRCIQFTGSWAGLGTEQLLAFRPWNRR